MTRTLRLIEPDMTPEIGRLYQITRKGEDRPLPNFYRFEREEPLHCQLHGDRYGTAWLFRKRRNSDVRPWGNVHSFDSGGVVLQPAPQCHGQS